MASHIERVILITEDEPDVRAYMKLALDRLGYAAVFVDDCNAVLAQVESLGKHVAAVLLNLTPDTKIAVAGIRSAHIELPIIVVSATTSSPDCIAAIKKNGATEVLYMPIAYDELESALNRTGVRTPPLMPARTGTPSLAGMLMGKNARMREIQSLIDQIGWSDAPLLIQGETGTGKEVLARELNVRSPRANKPFLKVNCAALPAELVESELFGYERGAFTGAFQRKNGIFEQADGGTIFLDEIGDMDIRLQAKLLQVLQDNAFQRIGGKDVVKVDVRVMAATHRDLENAIVEKSFREDLYYRLAVINVTLPALRERPEDIFSLFDVLLNKHARTGVPVPSLTPDLRSAMGAYSWPGNVRELENFARRLLIFGTSDSLARELLAKMEHKRATNPTITPVANVRSNIPSAILATPITSQASVLKQVDLARKKAETAAIVAALNRTRWNRKRAAQLLNIEYKALLYKMKKLEIETTTQHAEEDEEDAGVRSLAAEA